MPVHAKQIKICVDKTNWMPFIDYQSGELVGLHIDVIKDALLPLSLNYSFYRVPWKRCLKGLQKGSYDAVATASYNSNRAKYLWYPDDASTEEYSKWRVSQVEYVITLNKNSNYVYNDDPSSIPKPIRIPRGYSIGEDLRKLGIEVDQSSINDLQNVKRLLREKTGSVITIPSVTNWLNQQQDFHDKLKYDPTTLKSKSYFLAISKFGKLTHKDAGKIWNSIFKSRMKIQDKTSNNTKIYPKDKHSTK